MEVSLLFSKPTVESLRELCVFQMRKQGVFKGPHSGTWRWVERDTRLETGRIDYRFTGVTLALDYTATDLSGSVEAIHDKSF